jgi:hypothetical protein
MEKFTSFTIKAAITLIFIAMVASQAKDKLDRKKMVSAAALGSYDFLVLGYFYKKRMEYKRRFLRKTYNPNPRSIWMLTLMEIVLISTFYAVTISLRSFVYITLLLLHVTLTTLFSYLLVHNESRRVTVQLERNEEFFKIGFMKKDYVEEERVCLNKGEVVQILDSVGESTTVRKSDGSTYKIVRDDIDDGIDIVL